MSTAAGTPSKDKNSGIKSAPPSEAKGKGKGKDLADVSMEEEDEEEEEEEEDEDEEMDEDDDDEDDEEDMEEIDTTQIRSRRTRGGPPVDYSSAEALEKAGLKPEDMEKDDDA